MLQREGRTIPIVFVQIADPIGSGFVASLARPDGNLTAFLLFEASITGKWLQMLKEIAPGLVRVAFVANPKTGPYDYFLRAAESLAPSLGIELVPNPIETAADIERAIEAFTRTPNGGLFLPPDSTIGLHRDLVVAYATTIHKSQGSEYPAVVIPLLTQHYPMLQRNLIYTGVTRGKRLVVLVGQKKAIAIAVRGAGSRHRWSRLHEWLRQLTNPVAPSHFLQLCGPTDYH